MINGRTYLMPGFACGTTLKRIGAVFGMLQSGELLPQRYNGCDMTGSKTCEEDAIAPDSSWTRKLHSIASEALTVIHVSS
jgi:hypothetical protein